MVRKKVDKYGNIFHYNEQKQLHREDGPALMHFNGSKYWYINGIAHRIDGPADEYSNGSKRYFIMGKLSSYEDWLAVKDFPLLW